MCVLGDIVQDVTFVSGYEKDGRKSQTVEITYKSRYYPLGPSQVKAFSFKLRQIRITFVSLINQKHFGILKSMICRIITTNSSNKGRKKIEIDTKLTCAHLYEYKHL